jgi:micrococcal nuclease
MRATVMGIVWLLVALVVELGGVAGARDLGPWHGAQGAPRPESVESVAPPCDATEPTVRTVVRVVDGDTIVLDHQEKVRLIGVDTPELHHPTKPVQYFAREAAAFTTQHLAGKTVHLAYDWQRQDRFHRTLAYVCLPDGELVNETIIRDGFGVAYVKYPFTAALMARFRAAERAARDAGRGLWAPSAGGADGTHD